jgi:sugar/nucleoside kinase (ribokinase family)
MSRTRATDAPRALVIGPIYADSVFSGLGRLPHPGEELVAQEFGIAPGGYATSALAFHHLGIDTTLCGEVGQDLYGTYLLTTLRDAGLATDAIFVGGPATNVAVTLNFSGDRGIVSFGRPTVADLGRYEAVAEAAPEGTVMLLSARHPHAPALGRLARRRGLVVALSLSWHPDFLRSWQLRDLLPLADLLFCNVPEALLVSQEQDVGRAGERLASTVPEVVITRGSEGADAIHAGGRDHAPALPAVVVDATGAGDVFAAAYLAARMWGWGPADCLSAGSICAGRAVEQIGPPSALLDRTALEAAVRVRAHAVGPDHAADHQRASDVLR